MDNLEHLLRLAKRGGYGGSSGGERRARLIVDCLMENVSNLDGNAVSGIAELLVLLETQPWDGTEKVRRLLGINE